jgi:large subunit ribosomal protein L17
MRHLSGNVKLGRPTDQRMAMLRNMATSFLAEGRIQTSLAKAKALKPIVEKMITLGKDGTLHARRKALSFLYKKETVEATFGTLAERFKSRPGGYTRIIKLGIRQGDSTQMCQLELVDFHEHEGKAKIERKRELRAKAEAQKSEN